MELGTGEDDPRLGGSADDLLHRRPQHHRDEHEHQHELPDSHHAHHYADHPPQYRPRLESHSSHLDTSPVNSRSTPHDAAPPAQVSLRAPSYADANATAVAANGLSVDPVDPDDFYRSYSGVDPDSSASNRKDAPMATTTAPTSRDDSSPSSTHASRPPLTTSARTLLRPSLRSASAPITNDRLPVGLPRVDSAGKPSVKDLRKKFDSDTSSMIPRPPARSSIIHRPAHALRAKSTTSASEPNQPSSTSPRPSAGASTRAQSSNSSGSLPRPSQRAKTTADLPHGTSGASFASRINKPKTVAETGGAPSTSKSMSHLSQNKAPSNPSSPPPNPPSSEPSQPILFGEILPDQRDTHTLGYGIENALSSHGSDIKDPALSPPRDLPSGDPVPPSPSDWYRLDNQSSNADQASLPDTPTAHHDGPQTQPLSPDMRPTSLPRPTQTSSPSSAQSRRPGSDRKYRSGTGTASPTGSALTSPTHRGSRASGRSSRAGTPSGRRSKTPTGVSAARKGPPRSIATSGTTTNNPNNHRLNALISAPPPKLSPPLRSSRPRQPVSVATTASSRLKSVDHTPRASNGVSWKSQSNADERPSRGRKVSVGTIDFEQRREHVKLAYRKSIRQSRIQDAKERVAKAQAAEAEAQAEAARAEAEQALTSDQPMTTLPAPVTDGAPPHIETDKPPDRALAEDPQPLEPSRDETAVVTWPSPTLGIPGSFPMGSPPLRSDENVPHSAVSVKSDFTEFDIEPQEDLDVQSSAPAADGEASQFTNPEDVEGLRATREQYHSVAESSAETAPEHRHSVAERASETRGHAPDQLVVEIGLDLGETSPDKVDTPRAERDNPSIPGAFEEDSDTIPYVPDAYETRVRILRRESDASQFSHSPFPSFSYGASEYQPEVDNSEKLGPLHRNDDGDALTDICVDDASEDHVNAESYYSPPTFARDDRDHASSSRVSACESFDATHPDGGLGTQQSSGSAHMLVVPSMLLPENRSSQHSSWTDFSIDSSEPSDGLKTQSSTSRHEPSPLLKQVEMYPDDDLIAEDDSLAADDVQVRGSADLDIVESIDGRIQSRPEHHRLPEVDTGDGFSVPYLGEDLVEQEVPEPGAGDGFSVAYHSQQPIEQEVPEPEAGDGFSVAYRAQQSIEENVPEPGAGDAVAYHSQRPSEQDVSERGEGDGFSIAYRTQQPIEEGVPEPETDDAVAYRSQRPIEQGVPEVGEVPLPLHSPPPVPAAVPMSLDERHHTPSSSTYDRPNSTWMDSERPSEDYTAGTSTASSIRQGSLDVYGVHDSKYASDAVSVVPDSASGITKSEPSSKEKHRLIQRRNVVKELIDTEAVFVRDMNIVEEIYRGTAEACPKLDANTVKLIFRNTDEIISFHATFLAQLKEAVAPVYQIAGRNSAQLRSEDSRTSAMTSESSARNSDVFEPDDDKDRLTAIGPVFKANMDAMQGVHEGFLRSSDQAAKRLIQIQQDRTVKVWLNECNEVAQDLTAAWDLDSLLIKPMQRITKYPNIIISLLQHTPEDHPDRPSLLAAKESLETAIIEINKTKKNFELVGQIVGRKRKESEVKAGFARAFGKRVDKLQASHSRAPDDTEYGKLRERFNDDYLRLQVVLRDVEFYTRQVAAYVHEFLQYLSSIELVMRLQASPYPEVESKWVQFNVSMRDIQKVALEEHLSQVRKTVIEPFELVIKAYGNPSLAMKKRAKRRLDFERAEQLKRSGRTVDAKLTELVEQYEALNDTLKKELPKLSELTVKIGNISMGNFVNLQTSWYKMWKDKVKVVLEDSNEMPEMPEIVSAFKRDYQFALDAVSTIGIINPAYKGRASHSRNPSIDDSSSMTKVKTRPTEPSVRSRGASMNGEGPPTLPAPDFTVRNSTETFSMSPSSISPNPHQYYYRDYYSGFSNNSYRSGSGVSSMVQDTSPTPRSQPPTATIAPPRPATGRSVDSTGMPRQSTDSSITRWRDSSATTYIHGGPEPPRRFSGLFHSALPLPDEAEESTRSSRASSRERGPAGGGYNVLWLAASLFEFNIETTKHEAGYPYLVYQAGEIFDVIAEKGELWLAKNQDDPRERVGWIWSKHFAKLADS